MSESQKMCQAVQSARQNVTQESRGSSFLVRLSLFSRLSVRHSVRRSYLDVLAKEVGIKTQPVSGNVEPAL